MNATLTYPRGLRHPSWYAPLLLAVLPAVGAYGARDDDQYKFLLGAFAMLGIGLFLSLGLGALVDRASGLVRKEAEQLRPAWLLGLFTSQAGLTFGTGGETQLLIVVALMVLALVASLSFGIEFQQRTLPSLLCAPIDRARIWKVKMGVLGAALLSLAAIFVISASVVAPSRFGLGEFGILAGIALGSAYAAWATVPLWTLWTRHLLGGLTFALAVPPLSLALLGSLMDGIFPSDWNLREPTLLVLGGLYLAVAPLLAHRRWIRLEAPDASERELGGLFFAGRRSEASRKLLRRPALRALIGKELRLQTVTLVCLGVALLLRMAKPYLPPSVMSQDLAALLLGLFATTSVLLAGATAIAEERRLGTLDGQILLPVSRNVQWLLKLGIGVVIVAVAVETLVALVPPALRVQDPLEFRLQVSLVGILFVLAFLASSVAPNALRALLSGLAYTGGMLGVGYAMVYLGVESFKERSLADAGVDASVWLERARAFGPEALAEAQADFMRFYKGITIALLFLTIAVPTLLALEFSRRNFARPSAVSRGIASQFLACLACVVVGGFVLWALLIRFNARADELRWLDSARRQIDLEARLSPAELRLRRHLKPQPLDAGPESIVFRHRSSSPGGEPTQPPHWEATSVHLPLTRDLRRLLIVDGDLPDDIREALRLEAVAAGDTNVPALPGRPPGPWPVDVPGKFHGLSPDLVRRYGLSLDTGASGMAGATSAASSASGPSRPAATPQPPPYTMSPEMMRRYGLIPSTNVPAVPSPQP